MAKQTINIGTTANDGTGDTIRDAFDKANDNFTELYDADAALPSTYQPLDSDLTSWAGVTRASGFDTFAATPSSANLASLVSDETGSGALVFGTSPTIAAPNISAPVVNTPASTNWTGSATLDPANGDIQDITLTGDVSSVTDSLADGESIVLQIDDGTGYSITWPTITWVSDGGSAPTLQTSGDTFITIWKNNTTLFGFASNGA